MSENTPLHCLVYLSQAAQPFDDAALADLLAVARRNNGQTNVTGLLFYENGTFLQCLEGSRSTVHQLYAKIAGDPRHHHVETVIDRPVADRSFGQWTMAFQRTRPVQAGEGFDDLLERYQSGQLVELNNNFTLDLLLLFQQSLPVPTPA